MDSLTDTLVVAEFPMLGHPSVRRYVYADQADIALLRVNGATFPRVFLRQSTNGCVTLEPDAASVMTAIK